MNVNSDSNSVSLKSNELNADQNENEPFEFSKLVDKVMTQKKILSKCCSSLTSDVFDKTIYPKFIIVNPQWVKDKEKVLENSKVIDLKEFALALEQEVGKEVESANQKLKDEIVKVETKNKLLKDYILQVRKEFVPIKQYEELKRLYEEAIEKKVKEIEMKPVDEEKSKMNIETPRKIVNSSSSKTQDEFKSSVTTTFKYLTKSTDGRAYYEISPDLVPIRICTRCSWFEKPTNNKYSNHLKTHHNLYFDSENRSYFNSLCKNVLMKSEAFQICYHRKPKAISVSENKVYCYDLPEGHVFAQICLVCGWLSAKFYHPRHFADSHRPLYNKRKKSSVYWKMIVIKETNFE